MDLQELETKAKTDETAVKADATRVLDGTKAEVGKGVEWFESHKTLAIGLAIFLAVIVAAAYIARH